MSLKSGSGVQGLRAMFEQGKNDTSPPSRGRSPAGDSTTSNPSRPISKVRASFVSVDRSGAGVLPELRKTSAHEGRPAMDGAQDEKPLNGSLNEPAVNGNVKASVGTTSDPFLDTPRSTPKKAAASSLRAEPSRTVEPGQESTSNPDKSVTAAEEAPGKLLPGDPSSSAAVSGGGALGSGAPGLGMILKGSPFVEEDKDTSGPEPKDSPSASSATKPPRAEQSKQIASGRQSGGNPPEMRKGPPSPSKNKAVAKPQVRRPKIDTTKPVAEKATKVPKTPSSLPTSATSTQDTKPKPKPKIKAEPSQLPDKKAAAKGPEKPIEKSAPRISLPSSRASKTSATAAAPKASTSTAIKVSATTAPPPSTFIKPRPKSPTRPAKLPASATAPTASSAAKLEGDASKAPAAVLAKAKPTSTHGRPPRASLPARSAPIPERLKKSQPRASMTNATGRGADDGFLARMMRPTQASKSKTHDKVEVKSPPRPSAGKPATAKRTSVGGEKDPRAQPVDDPAPATEAAPVPEAAPATDALPTEGITDDGEHGVAEPATPGAGAAKSQHVTPPVATA